VCRSIIRPREEVPAGSSASSAVKNGSASKQIGQRLAPTLPPSAPRRERSSARHADHRSGALALLRPAADGDLALPRLAALMVR
jgi:hypothetical protein